MKRKFDIGCGHLGNGFVFWNRAREIHGDYEKIAQVTYQREIIWKVKNLPNDIIKMIEDVAKSDSPYLVKKEG